MSSRFAAISVLAFCFSYANVTHSEQIESIHSKNRGIAIDGRVTNDTRNLESKKFLKPMSNQRLEAKLNEIEDSYLTLKFKKAALSYQLALVTAHYTGGLNNHTYKPKYDSLKKCDSEDCKLYTYTKDTKDQLDIKGDDMFEAAKDAAPTANLPEVFACYNAQLQCFDDGGSDNTKYLSCGAVTILCYAAALIPG